MRKHQSFEAALNQVRGPPPDAAPTGARPPTVSVSTPIPPQEEQGHAYLWDHAAAWVPEHEVPEPPPPEPPPPPPPPRPPPSANPLEIARELNLSAVATADEITRIRRRFMWHNHPDRYPGHEQLSNRRVAIANMLIDHALEKLTRPKRAK